MGYMPQMLKLKLARENGFSLWNIDTAEKYNQCSIKIKCLK